MILSFNHLIEVIKLADMGFLSSDPSENEGPVGNSCLLGNEMNRPEGRK